MNNSYTTDWTNVEPNIDSNVSIEPTKPIEVEEEIAMIKQELEALDKYIDGLLFHSSYDHPTVKQFRDHIYGAVDRVRTTYESKLEELETLIELTSM